MEQTRVVRVKPCVLAGAGFPAFEQAVSELCYAGGCRPRIGIGADGIIQRVWCG